MKDVEEEALVAWLKEHKDAAPTWLEFWKAACKWQREALDNRKPQQAK